MEYIVYKITPYNISNDGRRKPFLKPTYYDKILFSLMLLSKTLKLYYFHLKTNSTSEDLFHVTQTTQTHPADTILSPMALKNCLNIVFCRVVSYMLNVTPCTTRWSSLLRTSVPPSSSLSMLGALTHTENVKSLFISCRGEGKYIKVSNLR